MKKIFLVTINFNTEKETHAWLASMKKLSHTDIEIHIVIVDNGSTKPFALQPGEKDSRTHLIRSQENTGFTGGNNIGMAYALKNNADYIMIINNDTYADPYLVKNLLTPLEKNMSIGVTTPKIYFAKGYEFHKKRYHQNELGKVFWYAGGFTDWNNVMSIHRGVDEVDKGQYKKQEKVTFASGCCMMFRREVLEKIGLFDDRYFLYFEDADLNERIQRAGYAIEFVPQAVLWHMNAASSGGSGNNLQDYFMTRNRMLFGMRYAPFRTKLALLKESLRFLKNGRPMQKRGIQDYYLGRFNKGTYFRK